MVIAEHNQQNKKKCVNHKEKHDFDLYPENQRDVS